MATVFTTHLGALLNTGPLIRSKRNVGKPAQLRLPKAMVDALIQSSAEITLQRLEKVSVQTLIKEVVSDYLLK